MKKLKLSTNAFQGNALNHEQLKKVLGGFVGSTCYVRCNRSQTGEEATNSVDNCSRETVEKICGSNLSKAVCICA